MDCDVSFSKPVLYEDEDVARLLSSPEFYDAETGMVNFAAFNLRTFKNGEKETYVSLSRLAFVDKKHLDKKGKYIFRRSQNEYVGYGIFQPKDVKASHIRMFPVKDGDIAHCGLFYLDDERNLLTGDLMEHPEMYDVIYKLCEMLENNLVLR